MDGARDDVVIPVLAAIIRRGPRFLMARRPVHKRHGGLWEFPGGKLEDGESWLDAARRELKEELGVGVVSAEEPMYRRRDPGSRHEIAFVPVEIRGRPKALEHEAVRWVAAADLAGLELAPADRSFVEEVLAPPVAAATRAAGPREPSEPSGPRDRPRTRG